MDFISHVIFNIFPIHSLELIYLSSLFVSALVLTVSFSQLKTLAPLLHFCLLCPVCFDEGPWLPAACHLQEGGDCALLLPSRNIVLHNAFVLFINFWPDLFFLSQLPSDFFLIQTVIEGILYSK